jgi:hypothetical protein
LTIFAKAGLSFIYKQTVKNSFSKNFVVIFVNELPLWGKGPRRGALMGRPPFVSGSGGGLLGALSLANYLDKEI